MFILLVNGAKGNQDVPLHCKDYFELKAVENQQEGSKRSPERCCIYLKAGHEFPFVKMSTLHPQPPYRKRRVTHITGDEVSTPGWVFIKRS